MRYDTEILTLKKKTPLDYNNRCLRKHISSTNKSRSRCYHADHHKRVELIEFLRSLNFIVHTTGVDYTFHLVCKLCELNAHWSIATDNHTNSPARNYGLLFSDFIIATFASWPATAAIVKSGVITQCIKLVVARLCIDRKCTLGI